MQSHVRKLIVLVLALLVFGVGASSLRAEDNRGVARITSPGAGANVSGAVEIRGSAFLFDPAQFQYYKVEFSTDGTAFLPVSGSLKYTAVQDGMLDTWDTLRVPAGAYTLRLSVVDNRGNFIESSVPVSVGGSGAAPASTTATAPMAATTARVYTADQSSNTISVLDPASNTLLGQIVLGNPRPNVLGAKYYKQINVHGLGFSPDGQMLVAVSVGSNAVTFIDTSTNQVKGTVYVGRAPHEAFFTPNGKEVWVAVRGQDYISVLDPVALKETRQIKTMSNPSKVLFRPDGKFAFVNSAEVAEFNVIDTATYSVVARVPVVSPFSADLSVTPDGKEVWLAHKDVGKVTQIDAQTFIVMNVIDTGKVTNHTAPISNQKGDFVYVTVGGQNDVAVIKRGTNPTIVKRISVGAEPHGIGSSPDNTRVYVGLEKGDAVQVIDTLKDELIKTIGIGQSPQALVVVPNASGSANLQMAVVGKRVNAIELQGTGGVAALAVVREQLGTDSFELSVSGLGASVKVDVFLTQSTSVPYGAMLYLGSFTADAKGKIDSSASGAVFNAAVFAADGSKQSLNQVVIWSSGSSPLTGNVGQPLLISAQGIRPQ